MNATPRTTVSAPRVWLAACVSPCPEPADHPAVRDDLMRTWIPVGDSRYRMADGKRHTTWRELHSQFDLVELPSQ